MTRVERKGGWTLPGHWFRLGGREEDRPTRRRPNSHQEASMRRVALFSALVLAAFMVGAAPAAAHTAAAAGAHLNARGGLDCNGYSLIQKPVRRGMDCTEIASNGEYGFEDNGHYIGHDEPATEFFSTKPGSGGSESYQVKLPV